MIVIGIDPGSRVTGYGVVSRQGGQLQCIEYGVVRGICRGKPNELHDRLPRIYSGLRECLTLHPPDAVALEGIFHAVNAQTALKLGQARGVALLAAAQTGAEIFEYSPLQVKKAVVGYGRAEKSQVQLMVARLLGLKEKPHPHDAADALAIALCHTFHSRGKD
jgi:crossover junction endodeoxyribonuclease RuvC